MPRKHLASLARFNEQALKDRYAKHLASHTHAQTLGDLYRTCEPIWTVSISSKADALYHFLKEGDYYNKYRAEAKKGVPVFLPTADVHMEESPVDWVSFMPYLSKDPQDAIFAQKREAFNRFALNEEHFAYGSYFAGGKGASEFGEFQMLFDRTSIMQLQGLSFLQQDSLSYCRAIQGTSGSSWEMDEAELQANIASCRSATELMCLKMKTDHLAEGLTFCLGKICVPETYEYLEAQFEKGYDQSCIAHIDRPQLKSDQEKILARFVMIDPSALDDQTLSKEERVVKYYLLACAEIDDKFSPIQ